MTKRRTIHQTDKKTFLTDENLAALCQWCHLLYDLDDHIANRRRTMAKRKADTLKGAGQLDMWGQLEEERRQKYHPLQIRQERHTILCHFEVVTWRRMVLFV
jgi:hypothetical protein